MPPRNEIFVKGQRFIFVENGDIHLHCIKKKNFYHIVENVVHCAGPDEKQFIESVS